jgi:hypothetical protein
MNTWYIVAIVFGLLVVAGFVTAAAVQTNDNASASSLSNSDKITSCSSCGGACTAENNCGSATCGAVTGKGSCGCNRA